METLTIFVGGVATLAIYSVLIKENPVYRFFEHVFIGIATAFGVVLTIKTFLWPYLIEPLFGLDIVYYPDGTQSKPYNPYIFLYLVPTFFGLLYYCVLSPRLAWAAKLVIGFSLGASGGLAIKSFLNGMLPQLASSFKPLYVEGDLFTTISNWVFILTLLLVMNYFFFTFKRGRVFEKWSQSGRYLLMIMLGAYFGATVMARMSLLVERVVFLLHDWFPVIKGFVS